MRKCPSGADVGLRTQLLQRHPQDRTCLCPAAFMSTFSTPFSGLPPVLASPLPQAPGATAPEALPWLPCQLSHDRSLALSRSSAHPRPIPAAKGQQSADTGQAPSFTNLGRCRAGMAQEEWRGLGALVFRRRMNGNWRKETRNAVFMGL